MAYTLGNKYAKNCCKRTILVQLIVEDEVACFLRHSVVVINYQSVYLRCNKYDLYGISCETGKTLSVSLTTLCQLSYLCVSRMMYYKERSSKVYLYSDVMRHLVHYDKIKNTDFIPLLLLDQHVQTRPQHTEWLSIASKNVDNRARTRTATAYTVSQKSSTPNSWP